MNFTDIFIRRPVLAMVVSLMILALGLRSVGELPVLQFPRTQNAVVTITTVFPGADPDVVTGFITSPSAPTTTRARWRSMAIRPSISASRWPPLQPARRHCRCAQGLS
jgi:Cu/Ag efflux pump CusA